MHYIVHDLLVQMQLVSVCSPADSWPGVVVVVAGL